MNFYSDIYKKNIVFSGNFDQDMNIWKETFIKRDNYYQFIRGRSLFETAKYWLQSENQNFVECLIGKYIKNYKIDYMIPEYRSFFEGKNHPREHDGFILDIAK